MAVVPLDPVYSLDNRSNNAGMTTNPRREAYINRARHREFLNEFEERRIRVFLGSLGGGAMAVSRLYIGREGVQVSYESDQVRMTCDLEKDGDYAYIYLMDKATGDDREHEAGSYGEAAAQFRRWFNEFDGAD